MASLAETVNNVEVSATGFVQRALGNESGLPTHPQGQEITPILADWQPANWMKLSFPYTFSVVSLKGVSAGVAKFSDFPLPLAPTALNQSESPAIVIKKTQGGTTVTHSGNRYKKLTISGTTGVAPFRGEGGVRKSTGTAILAPNELKYRSGYEVFHRLRNWFRAYYEFKKAVPDESKDLRLVFRNYKDGEFLIVELLQFRMKRSAGRSFLYDYDLDFEVISHLQFEKPKSSLLDDIDKAIETAIEYIDVSRGALLRTQGILRQIEGTVDSIIFEPLRKAALATKALRGVGTTFGDIGKRSYKSTMNAGDTFRIMAGLQKQQKSNQPIDSRLASVKLPKYLKAYVDRVGATALDLLSDGGLALSSDIAPQSTLDALAEEKLAAQQLSRQFYEETLANLIRVRQNLEDSLNLGDSTYNSLFDRTATLSATDEAKVPTLLEYEALFGLSQAVAGIDLILTTEDLFTSSLDARIQDLNNRFDNNIELFSTVAVREILVPTNTSLERIAAQELGDPQRWGEIAEVNNLIYPYIVQDFSDTRTNVVRPGEKLLIPSPIINGFSEAPAAKQIPATAGLSEQERSFGTDLRLSADFDLILTPAGDLEVISGLDNLRQAVELKLNYEKGELLKNPEIGAGLIVGNKFPNIQLIAKSVTDTLLQDSRISTISELTLERENSFLYVTGKIHAKSVDIPVPIKIKVNTDG